MKNSTIRLKFLGLNLRIFDKLNRLVNLNNERVTKIHFLVVSYFSKESVGTNGGRGFRFNTACDFKKVPTSFARPIERQ